MFAVLILFCIITVFAIGMMMSPRSKSQAETEAGVDDYGILKAADLRTDNDPEAIDETDVAARGFVTGRRNSWKTVLQGPVR